MANPERGRVLLAGPRGACAGVVRAIEAVRTAVDASPAPVYVRKPIVHNEHVVASLERRGAVFVNELDDVPDQATVVFSAHGVTPEVRAVAAERGLRVVDATCPLVTKVHTEARRFAATGHDIILIGHRGHDETIGIQGEAPDRVQLVETVADLDEVVVRDPAKVAWLSQTTLAVSDVLEIVTALKQRFPALQGPPSDDICYAAQNRQNAVAALAEECDLVLVVGSATSMNSVTLAEVALRAGAPAAHRIAGPDDVDPAWLSGVRTIGLTGGASTPLALIQRVADRLAQLGYDDLDYRTVAREPRLFAPPRS